METNGDPGNRHLPGRVPSPVRSGSVVPAAEPQGVLTPLTEAAIFLVATVDASAEQDVRDLLMDVSGLRRSVGFRVPEGGLTCVVGVGSDLWGRLFEPP